MAGATCTNASANTSVRIYLPAESLRSFATFYYFVECDGPLEDFLYPEWGNVRFSVRGSWTMQLDDLYPAAPIQTALFGHTDRAARIVSGGGKTVGFGLTPLGWERLVNMPAHALANRVGDLGDLLGMPAGSICEILAGHAGDEQGVTLFDELLTDLLAGSGPNSAQAITVDKVLRDRPADVEAFAGAAGMSAKTLGRACRRVFGFGAKRLLRRQRFLDTLGHIRVTDKPTFGAIIDPEYFDQSHFNREFREFMGLSPRAYLGTPRPLMGQAALVQSAAGIPLSFRLPPQPEA